MLTPYLLSVVLSLAAANPIVQRIPVQIPGQTYPAPSCPTCPTCPTQACPATSPCQTCQNPYRNFNPQPMVVQSSNSCPCNKPTTIQNPITNPLNQDTLHQLVLRRLLSTPMQVNSAPVKTCTQCEPQKSAPNIINNYIILPPELFKANETKVNKDESDKRKRNSRRRKQSRHKNRPTDISCPCEENDEVNNDKIIVDKHVKSCPCDNETTSKSGDIKTQDDDFNNNSKPKTETSNEKIIFKNTRNESDQKLYSENNAFNTKNPKRRNREQTKSLEEAIIRDFCRKNPSIPKEIARGLLNNLKQQVVSHSYPHYNPYSYSPFGYSYYNPQIIYPPDGQYEERHCDRRQNNKGSRRRDNKRRSERRSNKLKEAINESIGSGDKKCENIVEINPSVINIEQEIITTEKITATTENKIKENFVKESETQMETPDDLLDQLDKMKAKFAKLNEIETTTVSYNKRIEQYPELGEEDKVPTVYNNGVDDYYPDFRGDNIAFYASDEECDVEDRDHYNTDKKGGLDCKRYVNTKPNIFNNHSNKEDAVSLPVSTESYENYDQSIKDESAEIRFRVPPHLEVPDFETKQINKYSRELNEKFVADDTSIPETEMKPAKVFTKDRLGRTNIETVFGHSRVVKYGQDAEAAGSNPVITYYLPEEAMTEDRIELPDGAVVVVAKSIRDLEDDWD